MRERIAQRLKDAQNTYAMLTTFQEADMFNLINMREDFKVHSHHVDLPSPPSEL
jgi:2-oxoglutarate dehydrogenase E2 component (dihydrolipoamide succinyltransferase)